MRSLLTLVALLSLCAAPAWADDGLSLEMLGKIKDATAYVKVDAGGLSGSGSGFVIKVDHDTALIVTNHHVIAPEVVSVEMDTHRGPSGPAYRPGRRPGMPYRPGTPYRPSSPTATPRIVVRTYKDAKATVVLRSGTPEAASYPAQVLAADADLDLAVLKISGVKQLPKPISYSGKPNLVETMPVYTFGFPFGKILATGKGDPAITVGKAAVSSLRLDDDGQLAVVQIDGAMNPGNSGGPVVNNHGRLVGVAVATISNSSGIGLAIPTSHLTAMMQGRLGKPQVHASRGKDDQMVIHVEIALVDPLQKIHSVELHYIAAHLLDEPPKPNERLSAQRGCRKLKLKIENQVAVGEFSPKRGLRK